MTLIDADFDMMKVSLYYRSEEENSDKVYRMWVTEENGDTVLHFAYGRRGSTLKEGEKTRGDAFEVRRMMMDIVRQKLSKGYIGLTDAIAAGYLTKEEALLEVL